VVQLRRMQPSASGTWCCCISSGRDLVATMPFGKYRGCDLGEIPSDYLRWALNVVEAPWLFNAIHHELDMRQRTDQKHQESHSSSSRPDRSPNVQDAHELVTSGLHALAKKYHPDVGGDLRRMQTINACAEWLRLKVKEWLS
jgi:hypothetical protein